LPSDAYAQAETVARTRNLPVGVVRKLIADHVHTRELGFLGNDYVNVLELNEALARIR
jgi:K+-transporting ATPase ATPase C chain